MIKFKIHALQCTRTRHFYVKNSKIFWGGGTYLCYRRQAKISGERTADNSRNSTRHVSEDSRRHNRQQTVSQRICRRRHQFVCAITARDQSATQSRHARLCTPDSLPCSHHQQTSLYASTALWGFSTAADRQRLNAFIRRGVRAGLYGIDDPTFMQIVEGAYNDNKLFRDTLNNPAHICYINC